ncbi:MAG TPA: FlxA-like family protein [Myxococcaceae bacterium]|nr:FlxA-like family protein [Myxococcaceae bacterium]
MQEAVKLVPFIVLLTASFSLFAQERPVATGASASSKKVMVIDPKVRNEMMTTANEADKHLQELKTCVRRERETGGQTTAAQRQALDAQITALEASIRQLQAQTENAPHYLDQNDPLLP